MTDTEFKKLLWDTANKLRGSVSAAEYKYPVLGLVFLKYISSLFDAQAGHDQRPNRGTGVAAVHAGGRARRCARDDGRGQTIITSPPVHVFPARAGMNRSPLMRYEGVLGSP